MVCVSRWQIHSSDSTQLIILGASMTKKSGRSVNFKLLDMHMVFFISQHGIHYSHTVIGEELVVAKLLYMKVGNRSHKYRLEIFVSAFERFF